MATLLFEGWDLLGEALTALVPGGLLDYQGDPHWQHGSQVELSFIDGYQGGKAAIVIRNFFTDTHDIAQSNVYRVHWWGKIHQVVGTPATNREILSVGVDDNTRIGISGVPNAQLCVYDHALNFTGTPISAETATITSEWAHYVLHVDTTLNHVEFWKNGNLVDEVDGALGTSAPLALVRIAGNGLSSRNEVAYDHIVVTDGTDLLDTTGYHGAAVTYSVGSKDTSGGLKLKGRMRVGGTDYYTDPHSINLMGGNQRYSPLAMNIHYEYFFENPDTGSPWGDTLDIDAWGICRTDDTGGHAIFANAALTYVQMVNGFPQVLYEAPGQPFLLDGPWIRTHETVAWNAHIDNYPRTVPAWDYSLIAPVSGISTDNPDPFNEADWDGNTYDELWNEDYIGVTGPGCIAFELQTEFTPIGAVGFTFAEEYRTNYRDWQTVDGTGDDFCSYFISGYKIHGEGNKKFQSNYLTVNFETASNGSAYIQGVWDYALANEPGDAHSRSDTGRWGQTQQVYGPSNSVSYKHAFRKLKIRGHGKALQLKVKCEAGKPFFINGWAMFVTGNSTT